jgi:hypothetical protein
LLTLTGLWACGSPAAQPPDATPAVTDAPPPASDARSGLVNLTVTKPADATGKGRVSSRPGALDCGPTCDSAQASVAPGTVVLEAMPQAGSYFQGWSGACTGAHRLCTLAIDGDTTTTARFAVIDRNLVFATSEEHDGDLGGLAGADGTCGRLASSAGLTGHWVALLTTAAGEAPTRLVVPGTSTPARGFVRLDGLPLGDTVADLFVDHRLYYPVLLDENGDRPWLGGRAAWVGQVRDSFGLTCGDWTSNDIEGPQGAAGAVGGGPGIWLDGYFANCSYGPGNPGGFHLGLYCFMVDHTAPVAAPVAPAGAKRIYATRDSFTPGGGIAAADQLCADRRPPGVGAVKALLATTQAPASARLAPAATYVRPDGVVVGTGAELVAAASYAQLHAGVWQLADGSYDDANRSAWTGSGPSYDELDTAATVGSSCNDWTDGTASGSASVGMLNEIDHRFWTQSLSVPCNEGGHPLYCVEE